MRNVWTDARSNKSTQHKFIKHKGSKHQVTILPYLFYEEFWLLISFQVPDGYGTGNLTGTKQQACVSFDLALVRKKHFSVRLYCQLKLRLVSDWPRWVAGMVSYQGMQTLGPDILQGWTKRNNNWIFFDHGCGDLHDFHWNNKPCRSSNICSSERKVFFILSTIVPLRRYGTFNISCPL